MKKVRIVTIVSYNFGNRLQNLALTRTLENLDCEVKTVPSKKNYKAKKMVTMLIKPFLGRKNTWEVFEKKISYDKNLAYDIDIDKIDYFITGSDQVWNPKFPFNSKREFLDFAKPEQRIAYAASIAISAFPEELKEEYGAELKKFKAISVREESAINIVKDMSGRDAELVVDPVMLLKDDEWNKEIGKDRLYKAPYVAVYFLGDKDNECVKEILSQKREEGYKIIDILDINNKKNGMLGPVEFVKVIRDADFVVTDSFHATVFSIIFHTNFATIDRSKYKNVDMSTRLLTLLKMFGFENRFLRTKDDLKKIKYDCDFTMVDDIIDKEREKALSFLKVALDV